MEEEDDIHGGDPDSVLGRVRDSKLSKYKIWFFGVMVGRKWCKVHAIVLIPCFFSVRRKWAVQEDEALAYRLQDEESKFLYLNEVTSYM